MAGRAAGADGSMWWPPKVGEQCLMFAPGGDLMNAMALPGAYSDKNPQDSDNPHIFSMNWGGGGYMMHDALNGVLSMEAMAAINIICMDSSITMTEDKIVLSAGGSTLVIDKTGVHAYPDVHVGDISLAKHVHGDVERGGDETGKPQ